MYHILIAEFMHETNTFLPVNTGMQDYRERILLEGEAGFQNYRGAQVEVGGFLDVLEPEEDVECIPAFFANATPGGKVEQEVANLVYEKISACIDNIPKLDGILFAMHGAMVTTEYQDGEGWILEKLRSKVGAELPIVITLDLHADITKKMTECATLMLPYDNYPHTDMYDKGCRAAKLMLAMLRGSVSPVMVHIPVGVIFPIIATDYPVVADIVEYAKSFEKDDILFVNVNHGFCCADIYEVGAGVTVLADGNKEKAQKTAEKIKNYIWERREKIAKKFYSVTEALEETKQLKGGFAVFADVEDNPGGGSSGDGTNLLREMLEMKVQNAAFATIYDPETVKKASAAGVGNTVKVSLGGKTCPEIMGQPLQVTGYVKNISDGFFRVSGDMGHGELVTTGTTVNLVVDGIEILVCDRRLQPRDIQIFRANGIEPAEKKILVTKSSVHYRASFEKEAAACFDIAVPGMMPQRPEDISYVNCDRTLYPINK